MNISKIYECEQKRIQKLNGFQLPHFFKGISLISLAISIVVLTIFAFMGKEFELMRNFSFKVVLVSMLIFSLSKEKMEDEMIIKFRMQSYSFAFISAILYALVQPYITLAVAALLKPDFAFSEINILALIWFMLFVQIASFQMLKGTEK
ncbi:MAG: hypothetical protein ACI81T_001463 [Bacteroidia bacterium]|jgi:hypothetical protein